MVFRSEIRLFNSNSESNLNSSTKTPEEVEIKKKLSFGVTSYRFVVHCSDLLLND